MTSADFYKYIDDLPWTARHPGPSFVIVSFRMQYESFRVLRVEGAGEVGADITSGLPGGRLHVDTWLANLTVSGHSHTGLEFAGGVWTIKYR